MIVDASALLAILLAEEDAPAFASALARVGEKRLSVVGYLEVAMRLTVLADPPPFDLDAFLAEADVVVEPVSVGQGRLARRAFERFGRGRHRARLNLGDCFAYALAKERGEPLLFKGDDFTHTDVASVL